MSGNVSSKIMRMIQPEALRSNDYQAWSRGRGTDVWAMICATITGDLRTVVSLAGKAPNLVNCEYEYLKPLHFAVRENHRPIVEFLLEKGADPANAGGDSLSKIAIDREYDELVTLLESIFKKRYHIVLEGDIIAAAVRSCDIASARSILQTQPHLVHAADKNGNQPIHWAVLTRQINMIDYLIECGADINSMRPDGARPLDLTNGDYHYRSWYRDLPATTLKSHEVLIGYLIARGAYCDISVAAKTGYYERVFELLNLDPGLVNRLPPYVSYYSGLPLRCAAGAGHIEVVKLLLERGANPNEPEPEIAPNGGALHAAIAGKHYDIVKLLLEHGADADAEVESSGDCLFMANWVNADKEIVDLIASRSKKPHSTSESKENDLETLANQLEANPQLPVDHLLNHLINNGKQQHLDLILRYQPDILKKLVLDDTAWYNPATIESPQYLRWLFEKGLNPNRRNWLGITLLHRCAAKGDTEIAKICLEFGGDINAIETEWSSTPLGWAVREGKKDMVEWLLKRGAVQYLPEEETWALPISWARRLGYDEIVIILEQRVT